MNILKSQLPLVLQLSAENEAREQRTFRHGTINVTSDNTDVLAVVKDAENETKFHLQFVGPGTANLKATASILADHPTEAEGALEVTLEDDTASEEENNNGEENDNDAGTGEPKEDEKPVTETVKINLSLNL